MRLRVSSSTRLVLAAACSLLAFVPAIHAQLKEGDRVAICGDSITEQKLYSLYVTDYLLMCQPAPKLDTVQFGWGGEVASGFLARMKNTVLPFKPTVATTCYGMNDGGYAALTPERATNYRNNMTNIVKIFKENGVRLIVVGSPGVVDTGTYKRGTGPEVYNKALRELGDIGKEVAESNGVVFADVHSAMMEVMTKAKAKYGDNYHVAGKDGVHPAANGHLVMAYAFLKALGCDGDIGTITYDAKAGKADATAGHKILSAGEGKISIESTKYPFCFTGAPEDPNSTAGVIEFLPFNQDLNRYSLIVKNATGDMKITWGTTSKTFTAEQLAQGINLAAEFLNNPFSEPFKAVQGVINQQQVFETSANKTFLHSLMEWRKNFPEEEKSFQHLADITMQRQESLRVASTKAVKPVQHTISLEAVN